MLSVPRLRRADFVVGSWCIQGGAERNRDEMVSIQVKGSIESGCMPGMYVLYKTVEFIQVLVEYANLLLLQL